MVLHPQRESRASEHLHPGPSLRDLRSLIENRYAEPRARRVLCQSRGFNRTGKYHCIQDCDGACDYVPPRLPAAVARVANLFCACHDANYWQRNDFNGMPECIPIESIERVAAKLHFGEVTEVDLQLFGLCAEVIVKHEISKRAS